MSTTKQKSAQAQADYESDKNAATLTLSHPHYNTDSQTVQFATAARAIYAQRLMRCAVELVDIAETLAAVAFAMEVGA